MTALPQIAPLPADLTQRGGDPQLVADEYMHIIEAAIAAQPRSLQREIGPSELGHPCSRRIGYKLLDLDAVNLHQGVAWKPTVGTAVHAWLDYAFSEANRGLDPARWLTELRVCVGRIGDTDITGHVDLYDRATATAIDHKVVGNPQLADYKANGPGQQYRAQVHLYARGLQARGLAVDTVMVVFLPRADELHRRVVWHEAYDEQIALDALERVEGIHLATDALSTAALAALPTADAYCYRCPFHRAGSTDLSRGCPGDPNAAGHTNPFEGLVA